MLCRSGLIVVLCFVAVPIAAEAANPGWSSSSFEEAERLAKERGSSLLVHFHASWCGPCQRMERDVFSAPGVATALNRGLVSVKVDSDSRRDLVLRFGVHSLPTDVFVSPTGVVSQFVGATAQSEFLSRLEQFSSPASTITSSVVASTKIAENQVHSSLKVVQPSEPSGQAAVVAASNAKDTLATVKQTTSERQLPKENNQKQVPLLNDPGETIAMASAEKPNEEENAKEQAEPETQRRSTLRRLDSQRLGMNGFSPVALTQSSTWKLGDEQFTHEYQGVSYRFASAAELKQFQATPERFVPVLHGCDPVTLVTHSKVETGVIELGMEYQDRLYFFSSEKNRAEFRRDPRRFARKMQLTFFEEEIEQTEREG